MITGRPAVSKTTVAHRAGASVVESMFSIVTRIELPKVRTSPCPVTVAAVGAAPNVPATASAPAAAAPAKCRFRPPAMP
ncbi:hypothetical protein MPC38_15565 [Prescottella equi]|uniref:hypothetical protein n=1 Tax=Rhodococcus hoagii TaxID=43767 RepID=UPI001F5B74EC|nr:hypothetical protein [Prescottella equi]UNQ38157.1 hypothetical protein MPC38_15565 [Prescottella equi]